MSEVVNFNRSKNKQTKSPLKLITFSGNQFFFVCVCFKNEKCNYALIRVNLRIKVMYAMIIVSAVVGLFTLN